MTTPPKSLEALIDEEYKAREEQQQKKTAWKISLVTELFSEDELLSVVAKSLVDGRSMTCVRESLNAILADPLRCPPAIHGKYCSKPLHIFHPQFLKAVRANLHARIARPGCPDLYRNALAKMSERSAKAKDALAARKKK